MPRPAVVRAPTRVATRVATAATFASIEVGHAHVGALTADGEAYCCGTSAFDYGRLGSGDASSVSPIARPVIGQR